MAFKNYKLHILISGFLILFSVYSKGQYLRNNMITAQVNVGGLQQKTSLAYHHSFARFHNILDERKNQFFLGIEAGTTDLQSKGLAIFDPDFIMVAYGTHLGFMITQVISEPKIFRKDEKKYNSVSIKYTINKFYNVKSYFNNYDKGGNNYGSDSVYNAKCVSSDLELSISRLVKINPNNFFQFGCYVGLRFGHASGIRYSNGKLNPNSKEFGMSLQPLIFGFNFGYQVNFGNKK